MFHLDNNSGVSAMPPVGAVQSSAPRWYTEGGGGTPASYPGADWYNIVQAELLNLLSSYGITPNKSDFNQLQKAIEEAIKQKATASSALLTAIAALVTSADKMPYFTGKDKVAMTDLTGFARTLLGRSDAAGVLSDLGLRDVAHSQMTTYLTAGTFTFTVPDGVYRIKCRVIGGGGGAGGSASAKSGGGGGAGGYAEGWIDVTPGQTITITVGAGGQGGTAGNFGVSGGLSSVGGFMSASGGAYGDAGGGGTGAGGFGGAGTGGSVNSVGSDGSDGTTTGAVGAGAGGGSALGGSTRSGGSGRNSLSIGGGGSASYTTAAQSGGNGHAGAVILEY